MRWPGGGIPRNPGSGAGVSRDRALRRERAPVSLRRNGRPRAPCFARSSSSAVAFVRRIAWGLPRIGGALPRGPKVWRPSFRIRLPHLCTPPAHRAKHTSWAFFGESGHGVRAARCKGYNPYQDNRFPQGAGTLTLNGAAGAVHRERCMEQHGYRAGIVAFA